MTATKVIKRERRHNRIRQRVEGSQAKPRLSVFRSNKAIYAQLVDDMSGKTLAASSSLGVKGKTGVEAAKVVGQELAKLAKEKQIATCVFDRAGYLYHGQVKALAEGAREGGLQF